MEVYTHLMCAMREVHSCNVHPRLDHFLQFLHRPAGRSCMDKLTSESNIGFVIGQDMRCISNSIWKCLTNGADDASVARDSGFGVDVEQTHVLDESVGHGSVELLGLHNGRAGFLCLHHGWICVCGEMSCEDREKNKLATSHIQQEFTPSCSCFYPLHVELVFIIYIKQRKSVERHSDSLRRINMPSED